MSPVRSDQSVLVIASDPMLAAIVGMLVEQSAFEAAFPAAGERPEEALARVKPMAAVLVDVVLGEATSDVFMKRARNRRVPVMLFGGRESIERLKAWAADAAIPTFVLPDESDALQEALDRVPPAEIGRSHIERKERRSRVERAADGHVLFFDAAGRRWSVYDRRGADRRQAVHRRFVSDQGQVFGCDLPPEKGASVTPDALERQLAQSTRESV